MMMVVENNKSDDAKVIDLIKFKIEKELKKSPKGSAEYDTLKGILQMHEEGIIVIKWTKDDMWVSMRDDIEVTPETLDISKLKEELHQLEEELSECFPEDED